MKKQVSRLSFLVCLMIMFTMLFSTMAFAAPSSAKAATPSKNVNQSTVVSKVQSLLNNNSGSAEISNLLAGKGASAAQPEQKTVPTTTQTAPDPAASGQTTSPVAGLTADEQKMVDLVNKERTANGLKPLQVDMRLVNTARMKSQDMINKGYFDHNSPTYGSPFDQMKSQGITYKTAGENLAGNSTVEKAHTALMNSAGHRANILNANYTHIGIGIIDGGPYGKMFTQHFIG